MSQSYLEARSTEELAAIDWARVEEGSINYEHLGSVKYRYASLSPLHKYVPPVN